MSTKAGRAHKRRSRRPASRDGHQSQSAAVATPARRRGLQPRNSSPRWMLIAAIVTTVAALADAALLATSSGSEFWLYIAGIVLWVLLAAYHWNRWLRVRRRAR